MKETRLGEFEEVLLLLVGILADEAYALNVSVQFEVQTGRSVSIGSVHSTLDRLSTKGFLKSKMSEPTAKRGGRRKRIYRTTARGQLALEASRDLKVSLWNQLPNLAMGKFNPGYSS